MNKVLFKELDLNKIEKNKLYRISDSKTVTFIEDHKQFGTKELINIVYQVEENQYGIYATEYRPAGTNKYACMTTDILAGIVDDSKKEIYTLICDVKSNISAFSDDLSKGDALITAIKEVRDFIDQIKDEMLHKKSFMIYFEADGYSEVSEVAIATKNFENRKFLDAAELLEKILNNQKSGLSLKKLKLISSLQNYKNEIPKLKKFADEILLIDGQEYKLVVYILQADESDRVYKKDIIINSQVG